MHSHPNCLRCSDGFRYSVPSLQAYERLVCVSLRTGSKLHNLQFDYSIFNLRPRTRKKLENLLQAKTEKLKYF